MIEGESREKLKRVIARMEKTSWELIEEYVNRTATA